MIDSTKTLIPFGMLTFTKNILAPDRGFTSIPDNWNYDATSQTSDLLSSQGGETWSRITSTSSGFFTLGDDPDEDRDD